MKMITKKCEKWLTENFGDRERWGLYYETYHHRLQDFTDEQIMKAIKRYNVKDDEMLFAQLYAHASDPEVKAHLLGFDSAKERAEWLEHVKKQQEQFK